VLHLVVENLGNFQNYTRC